MGTRLILGGSGFLGAHLCACAAESGRTVLAARFPDMAPSFVTRTAMEFAVWDAEREGSTAALLDRVRPDEIVLAAACSRAGDCDRSPELASRLNEALPEEVAAFTAREGVRLVHISTDLVFGGTTPGQGGFREEDVPSPVNAYGHSKAAGETAVLRVDPRALVVRLPLMFGDSGGRGLGATDQLVSAIERGETPGLFEDEWRSPLDVRIGAIAVLEAAGTELSGILHVAGQERLTRWELGQRLLAPLGLSERVRRVCRADFGLESSRARDATLNVERALRHLATDLAGPPSA